MDFFEIKELGPMPVIGTIFRQLGFHDTINHLLRYISAVSSAVILKSFVTMIIGSPWVS
ncbi:MAG: hypothetical protein PWQ60_2551 [Thermoanaerobacteraceae bacterium]|jgi:hypothetical protein|nr:hypothetical protein [Thermoanaerobacteraceae bacterium]